MRSCAGGRGGTHHAPNCSLGPNTARSVRSAPSITGSALEAIRQTPRAVNKISLNKLLHRMETCFPLDLSSSLGRELDYRPCATRVVRWSCHLWRMAPEARIASEMLVSVGLHAVAVGMIPLPPRYR